jgi:hypothetical protein
MILSHPVLLKSIKVGFVDTQQRLGNIFQKTDGFVLGCEGTDLFL